MKPSPRSALLAAALLLHSLEGFPATLAEADALAGPAPGSVTGKVMDAHGGPLTGVKVTLRLGESLHSVLTDDQGEFCFCRVKPSRSYVLELEKEGFAGFVEREFTVAKSKLSVRNVILDPLSRFSGAPMDGGGR